MGILQSDINSLEILKFICALRVYKLEGVMDLIFAKDAKSLADTITKCQPWIVELANLKSFGLKDSVTIVTDLLGLPSEDVVLAKGLVDFIAIRLEGSGTRAS